MLKEEDKKIINKANRSTDYRVAIVENYRDIVCVNLKTGQKF